MLSWWSPARWPTMLIPARIGEGSAVGEKRTRRSTGPGEQKIEIASPTPNTTYKRALEELLGWISQPTGFCCSSTTKGANMARGIDLAIDAGGKIAAIKGCEPRLRR